MVRLPLKWFLPCLFVWLHAFPALAAALVPHKAVYDVALVARKSGSSVLNVSGTLEYELRMDCDAWATSHNFKLSYQYTEGAPVALSGHFAAYETFKGDALSFSARRNRNGMLVEDVKGEATLAASGKGGTARYTVPPGMNQTLPAGLLFANVHTQHILERAKAGDKIFNAVIFDGSDKEGPVEINTVIGKSLPGAEAVKASPKIDKALLNSTAWRLRMAFFPLKDMGSSPDYEMDAVLQENGIITDMRIEYPEFTVTQKLASLTSLSAEICQTDK
jgi:hypothetical protein